MLLFQEGMFLHEVSAQNFSGVGASFDVRMPLLDASSYFVSDRCSSCSVGCPPFVVAGFAEFGNELGCLQLREKFFVAVAERFNVLCQLFGNEVLKFVFGVIVCCRTVAFVATVWYNAFG